VVAARCGCFQKKEASQKADLCLIISSLEALDIFHNCQLTWTDAASYEAALQKDNTLCKHLSNIFQKEYAFRVN